MVARVLLKPIINYMTEVFDWEKECSELLDSADSSINGEVLVVDGQQDVANQVPFDITESPENPNPTTETSLILTRSERRLKRWVAPAVVGALTIAVLVNNNVDTKPNGEPRTTQASTPHPSTSSIPGSSTTNTTIAPGGTYPGTFSGYSCSSEEETIRSGDTIFGLTTNGLHASGYEYFEAAIFTWNLHYLQTQAKTNKALVNPNDIPVGEKIKVYSNCINILRVWSNYSYNNPAGQPTISGYTREAIYQDYTGANDRTHNLVTIDYKSNKSGQFLGVEDCYPSPTCYTYVVGAPSKPPKE